MLGDDVVDGVRVVNHDARDDASLTWMGRLGADVPVWLSTEWVTADVRITTGFVEPHFFAGFSGGPKMVAPGLAGLETVLTLHDAARIGSPHARWGVTEGNPIHDDVRAIAAATGTDFALDVLLDRERRIAAAFGGELLADASRGVPRGGGDRDAPGGRAVRRGRDLERRLPARPEPLPGREGHVGRRAGGEARRADRLRRRMPRRIPEPRLVPERALLGRLAPGSALQDHRSLRDRPRSVAGADPGRHPDAGEGGRPHVVPVGRGARGRTPRADLRPHGNGRRGRARRAACACCPRARRRSPTSPDRCTSSRRPTSFATR